MNKKNLTYCKRFMFNVLFLITVIRLIWNFLYGFRWPSEYVLSNNIFTYEYGFIPRSLIASLLKLLFGNLIYDRKFLYVLIVGTGILLLSFFCYLSYFFTIKTQNIVGSLLVFWYSLSIYSAYIAHEMGYFEQYGYVFLCGLILFCAKIKSVLKFSILCSGLMFISLLISETNAFLVCPVLLSITLLNTFENMPVVDFEGGGKRVFRCLIQTICVNIPNILYCICVNYIRVPQEIIGKQLSLIRENSDKFQRLDEIGAYFYGDRTAREYTDQILFRDENWQLMAYMFLIIFTVTLVLIFSRNYQKAFLFIAASGFVIACGYTLNFIAWDAERYKFGQAMMVTFLGIWTFKKIESAKIILNKDLLYTLVIGTLIMAAIMDYKLGLFDGAEYNNSIMRLKDTLSAYNF